MSLLDKIKAAKNEEMGSHASTLLRLYTSEISIEADLKYKLYVYI